MKKAWSKKVFITVLLISLLIPVTALAGFSSISSNEATPKSNAGKENSNRPHMEYEGDAPQFTEVSVHDPSIIKAGDTYYVFGSHLASAKSDDLMNWEQVSTHVHNGNPLIPNVYEELAEAFDWANSTTLWAADVIQLEDGKYYMYYNACEGSSPRSALGVAVADDIEGPYKDLGIFLKSGMWGEESPDGRIYDPTFHPNAIDPENFFDKDGNQWMVYGSYSGGIFILEMDSQTGFPKPDQGYGTHLMGGNHSRIEGAYIEYNAETDYYYLYVTFGGLDATGGYNMRVARSENPDGPYYDAEGNLMSEVSGARGTFFDDRAIEPYAVKQMGNFLFKRELGEPGTGIGHGYVSPGHNSVFTDETGEMFMVFHTRFPERGEQHEVRVHRMVMNKDGWPVIAPYRYAGEKLEKINRQDVIGDYKFINHGKEISVEIKESISITLEKNNKLSGDVTGTWKATGHNDVELTIDGSVYKGVFLRQWDHVSESYVMTFTALSKKGVAVWGSKLENKTTAEIVDAVYNELSYPATAIVNLTLPTTATRNTEITWTTSDSNYISETGVVTRPDAATGDVVVTLTATITKDDVTKTKSFDITVLAKGDGQLVAHYPFNGSLYNEANNSSFGPGTITGDRIDNTGGTITFADGVTGEAAVFDGNSGIRLPNGLITSHTYTVSLWLNPEELTHFTTAFFGARTPSSWISLVPSVGFGNNDTMVWSGEQWYDAVTGQTIPTGEWSHLAFTVDEGRITVYVNGEAKFTGTNFPNVFTTADAYFGLGVNHWDLPYKGLMDDLRIYDNMALTAEEIATLATSNE